MQANQPNHAGPNFNSNLPIGLFDSGIGGLTVLRAMREAMPLENYLYLGDNARLPYGTKGPSTISRYALQAAGLLVRRQVKLIVIACNTASAVALDALAEAYPDIPIFGVIEPGAQAACANTKSGHIAVIGTESTIRGGAYPQAIRKIMPDAQIKTKACPLFVPMAEEGMVSGEIPEMVARHYLDDFFKQPDISNRPDCLVLGCTHYPILKETIAKVAGPEVKLVDSAYTTAQAVQKLFREGSCAENTGNGPACGQVRYLTTDDVKPFVRLGKLFMGTDLSESDVEKVDL